MTETLVTKPLFHGEPFQWISTLILGTDEIRLEGISALVQRAEQRVQALRAVAYSDTTNFNRKSCIRWSTSVVSAKEAITF